MNKEKKIIVTGAAGFIGSVLVGMLNEMGYTNLILVDNFGITKKFNNWATKQKEMLIEREVFLSQILSNTFPYEITAIFHLGANTDTTETDWKLLLHLNLDYTKAIWHYATLHHIPLLYASSAATYGNGELGYDDSENIITQLMPLNLYGKSKNDFDIWAFEQAECPPFWAGVKFFNVYGPNEYHKSRMASVVMNAYNYYLQNGVVKLFRSHNPNYIDGGQMRDFVYVKDVASMCIWLIENQPTNGLYNIGTGKARTFMDQMLAMFTAIDKEPNIGFVDTPIDIRDKYQYFTEANMSKLINAGYTQPFTSLEDGIKDYVTNYLKNNSYF